MRWVLGEVGRAVSGRVEGDPSTVAAGVAIDSRALTAGELFVAIRGSRDGHDFLQAAVTAGAPAVMVERPAPPGVPAVVVDDTSAALLDLGRAARRRLDAVVVGVTGSVGKTSTKDLAAAALAAGRRTVASPRSFNNELGLPLTLANASEDAEAVVVEMGARSPGHIELLCGVARPSVGVVTAVAAAHTEMFGDLDGVERAKGELVEALPGDGLAVLNGDDRRVRRMAARGPARALLYSAAEPPAPGAEAWAEEVNLDGELRPSFVAHTPWGRVAVRLGARGRHQVGNALAALVVAGHAGVPVDAAAEALDKAQLSPWRMELRRARSGAVVLNDAYNANPSSMAAALRALADLPARRRVALLGFMAELGERTAEEHRAVASLARSLGIEVVPVGTDLYGRPPADPPDPGPLGPGVAVLVKGSRVAGLEQLVEQLVDRPAGGVEPSGGPAGEA
ncbi:MAG TPA: UDP-N-acetylmuramoyl-tripeptide--D-alanyl-D-alanine ligase [Acidimicrobiales bacterium]|nr:UDP-N-acetylmuramoyl-tripeptide--D-alanyl-D-alanine ligase [Acidimicrobiales bacterium]